MKPFYSSLCSQTAATQSRPESTESDLLLVVVALRIGSVGHVWRWCTGLFCLTTSRFALPVKLLGGGTRQSGGAHLTRGGRCRGSSDGPCYLRCRRLEALRCEGPLNTDRKIFHSLLEFRSMSPNQNLGPGQNYLFNGQVGLGLLCRV